MKTLVIERDALKNNISVVKERAGSAVIYGVVTGDGQGAGLVELARVLRAEGIGRFAVSEVAEAAALRKAGFVEEEILMLRCTTDRSHDSGLALNGVAEARSTVAEAHIQIDTGMGFGGFFSSEPEKILSTFRDLPGIAVTGVCTQLYTKSKKGRTLAAQIGEFTHTVEAIHAAGFETGTVHAAGSYVLMHFPEARLGGVRAGTVLMGRCRRSRGDGLRRVGYGEVQVEETRWVPKGHIVGGNTPGPLKKDTRVAVLPVGYQNGFGMGRPWAGGLLDAIRRWLTRRQITVRINGQKARVIGGIGAIETIVDVTELKCAAGDKAVFDIDPVFAKGFVREYR